LVFETANPSALSTFGLDRLLAVWRLSARDPKATWKKVQVPNAMPYLMAGFQIAMVFSFIGAIVGEFLGASRGLGALIIQRQSEMDVAGVFALLVVLSTIGMLLSQLIKVLTRRYIFWASTEEVRGV
jgi:NitT/TauT family transport system permease protein